MKAKKTIPVNNPLVPDLRIMGCGGCGRQNFEIYLTKEGFLIAQCCNCMGRTTIKVQAQLDYSLWTGNGGLAVSKD